MALGNNTGSSSSSSSTIQLGQSYSSPSPVEALQVVASSNIHSNNKTNQNPIKYTSINNVSKSVRNSSSPTTPSNGPTAEVAQQLRFPWKLHLLLERCEYEKHESIVSWLPNGKSFKVHDKERFVKEIMPSFFGTQSFKTFQRNLNLWGFTRVSKGPQKDVCSHPLFLKGFPAVCQSMKRIVLKGTGRGNRAPLGGVDVSSVQAVVAAAAIQQQQQQLHQQVQAQQAQMVQAQQQAAAQHQQQQQQQNSPVLSSSGGSANHIHLAKQHHGHVQHAQQHHQQQQQQQQFVIEDGTINVAPSPSSQQVVVLPSPISQQQQQNASTTVMWPNNFYPQQPQAQQVNANGTTVITAPAMCAMPQQIQVGPNGQPLQIMNTAEATANLQNSLQQLSAIIQQLNGCNAMATATVNTNSSSNSTNTNTNINNNNVNNNENNGNTMNK